MSVCRYGCGVDEGNDLLLCREIRAGPDLMLCPGIRFRSNVFGRVVGHHVEPGSRTLHDRLEQYHDFPC
jgi:hypothetical protein